MREIKTAWRLWWEWNPERIENWLEEMAREGWVLFQVDFASLRFKFIRGEVNQIRYCTDYQENPGDDYFKLFKDDGWELVWTGTLGWYIWRKPYSGERPGIYTDKATIINKTKRSIRVTWIILLFYILLLLLIFVLGPVLNKIEDIIRPTTTLLLVIISLGFIIVQLIRYNRKLGRDRIRE